ncbi:MAG TPA: lysophospholipid acyltransferase family protein [Polyangia bacterium]|jgi:1-acyl-sn-glycerol-3-phosphate acyltransferase|nr:lysophospholipid acyltransferase family protein [Polyangia bacterium]
MTVRSALSSLALPIPVLRLGRAVYVAYGALTIAAVMLVLWAVTGFVRNARRAVALQRAASRLMLAALGCRFFVRGAPPARGGGACVFVANHTSYLDIPLILAALDCDFAFVTKHELLEWPIISRITRAGAHIPVDRDRVESRGAVVARIIKTLRAGRRVLIFPEGTFSFDDRLRPFHAGAFKSAVAAGVPVVPIALAGVAGVWSQHAHFPRAGRVEIWVGDPLDVPANDSAALVEALRSEAHRFIAAHVLPVSKRDDSV